MDTVVRAAAGAGVLSNGRVKVMAAFLSMFVFGVVFVFV
jgi:hypothetical protein